MTSFLSTREVVAMVGLSRQELWRRRRDGTFPEPIQLGGRRVGYPRDEVEAWLQARIAERDRRVAERKVRKEEFQ